MENQIVRNGGGQPEAGAPQRMERRGKPRMIEQPVEADVSFAEMWRVMRKRRAVIAVSTVLLFGAAAVYTLFLTPRYRTTSVIEFNKANVDSLALDDEQETLSGANAVDYNVTQQTQVAALQSDTLALQIVHDLKLEGRPEFTRKQSPMDYLRPVPDESNLPIEKAPYRRAILLKAYHKDLKVEPVAGTRMISVQFLDPDPEISAQIVNTLISDYMEQYFRTRYSATVQASEWLSKQLDDLKGQVQSSQQKLVDYQKRAGIIGTDETHNIVMTRLEQINQQLTAAQANGILTQTIWQLAKTGNPELLSGLVSASVSTGATATPNSLTLIENLRAQQNQLKMQYAEAASKYGSAYPKLIELQTELNTLNASIQTEITNLAARAQNDYLTAQQTQDALRGSFETAKAEANQQNDSAVQYTILKHEADSSRDLYDGLSKKLKEAGVLASLHSSNIVVVDPARASDRPARPIVPAYSAACFSGSLVRSLLKISTKPFPRRNRPKKSLSCPLSDLCPDGSGNWITRRSRRPIAWLRVRVCWLSLNPIRMPQRPIEVCGRRLCNRCAAANATSCSSLAPCQKKGRPQPVSIVRPRSHSKVHASCCARPICAGRNCAANLV